MKTDKMFQTTWLQCMIDVPESQIRWCFVKVCAADPAYDRYDACFLKIVQDLRIAEELQPVLFASSSLVILV